MPKKPLPPRSDLLRQELNALRDAVARNNDAASATTTEPPRSPRQPRKPKPGKTQSPHPDKNLP